MEHISHKFTDKYNIKDDEYFTLPKSWLSEGKKTTALLKNPAVIKTDSGSSHISLTFLSTQLS